LIHSAEELLNYSKGEENLLEKQIKSISDSGCTVLVAGGKIGDMALHYLNKYKIMGVRLQSKFDLRRIGKFVGATVLPKLTAPTGEEMGRCDHVYVDEVGDTSVVVFRQDGSESRIATIVIRGSTENVMDDVERAVDDGVNNFKAITRDGRCVPGAGATEIELAKQISSYGSTCPGLEQYAIQKFSQSLEALPKVLAENAGMRATEVVSKLYAAHQEGNATVGIDIEGDGAAVIDTVGAGILDLYLCKLWAIKYATSAACTVLKVDQIIMAKQAGGPKPKKNENWDED
jgi:T-complex protein 1 subunit theta